MPARPAQHRARKRPRTKPATCGKALKQAATAPTDEAVKPTLTTEANPDAPTASGPTTPQASQRDAEARLHSFRRDENIDVLARGELHDLATAIDALRRMGLADGPPSTVPALSARTAPSCAWCNGRPITGRRSMRFGSIPASRFCWSR